MCMKVPEQFEVSTAWHQAVCLHVSPPLSLFFVSFIWMSHTFLLSLSLLPFLPPSFSYNQILSVFSANWEFLSDIGYLYLVRTVYAYCLHFCSTSAVFLDKDDWPMRQKASTECWMSAVWMGSWHARPGVLTIYSTIYIYISVHMRKLGMNWAVTSLFLQSVLNEMKHDLQLFPEIQMP